MAASRKAGALLLLLVLPIGYLTWSSKSEDAASNPEVAVTLSQSSEPEQIQAQAGTIAENAQRDIVANSLLENEDEEALLYPRDERSLITNNIVEHPSRLIANVEQEAAEAVRLQVIEPHEVQSFIAQRMIIYQSDLDRAAEEMSEELIEEPSINVQEDQQ